MSFGSVPVASGSGVEERADGMAATGAGCVTAA
jgi:hypothetical protein